MGLIEMIVGALFGGGRNVVKDTAEVFRANAEAQAQRNAVHAQAALAQFAAEFGQPRKGRFDRFIDGLNRIPRPAMALGVLGLMVSAMTDPIWFASRMQGIALVPEPLWWLLGAIVSFYFGARHQAKGQEFQRSIAATMANAPQVTRNIGTLEALAAGAGAARPNATPQANGPEVIHDDAIASGDNPALRDWRRADDG